MSALDGSVVNIALPAIGKATGSPVSTIEWVVLIYLITVSASLLVFGRLADIYGNRSIYITGLFVFTLGSALCGLSGHIGLLIASRAVQATGAAMLMALSPGILVSTFRAQERGRVLGIQATMTYMGLAVGPALGGFLTQHFGWPSIFFINLPIGVLMIAAALWTLEADHSETTQTFDPAGAAAMAVTLASLLFALSKGPEIGWGSPLILAMFCLAAVAGAAFFLIEKRVAHPALDFGLFRNRVFTASIAAGLLFYMSHAAVGFLMPFYLIRARGFQEAEAGLIMIATPIAMMLLTSLSGHTSDKVGVRLPATAGMALLCLGMLLLRGLGDGSTAAEIVPLMVLIGVGASLFTAPNNSAIMGSAPRHRQGVAGAILAAARTTGFASGVAAAGLIYTHQLNALNRAPQQAAITQALHSAAIVFALVSFGGMWLSALRGRH